MKKLVFLYVMLLVSTFSLAQEKMKITLAGGKVVEYNVSDIVKVGFEAETQLNVSPNKLDFSASKESKKISITCNSTWTINSDKTWLSANITKGEGDATITITASENTSTQSRNGSLTITAGDKTAIIAVVQEGAEPEPYITMLVGAYNVSASANTVTVYFSSNTSWTVKSDQAWATPVTTSGNGDGSISVNVSANTSTSSRTAKVTFTGNGVTASCNIIQKGAEASILYREPSTAWGSTKTAVKNYMSGYDLYTEDNDVLAYYGKYKEITTMYGFNNSKLYMSIIALYKANVTMSEIHAQLSQNYILVAENGDEKMYIDEEANTVVMVSTDTELSAYTIRYIDASTIISSQLFEEPFVKWGTARSTVKSQMANAGYEIYVDDETASSGYPLVYYGMYQETLSMYYFDTLKRLVEIDYAFDASSTSMNDIQDYLENTLGYTFLGLNSGMYYYVTPDNSSAAILRSAVLSDGSSAIYLSYIDLSSLANSRAKGRDITINTESLPELKDVPVSNFEDFKKTKFTKMMKAAKSMDFHISYSVIKNINE